jgi:chromosome segregation ATPase
LTATNFLEPRILGNKPIEERGCVRAARLGGAYLVRDGIHGRARILRVTGGASLRADAAQFAAPDPRARRAAAEAEAAAARRAAAAAGCALARGHAARAAAAARHSAADLALRELADQAERLARADAARGARHEELRALVTTFQAGVRGLKAAAATAREKAQAATGWPIPPELEAAFASMPAAAADLARAAQAAEDEAEGLAIADPSALGRYRARCEELARCEEAAAALEARRGALAAEAAPLRASWLAELRAVVAAVNDRFSADFPAVGVAGEVALFEAPEDDFARFAIEVRVKFREGESLATLDANRQSGGERSVSTMLFLVALQRAAAAPFRVVDEINQGMDPRNERRVFGLLAAAAVGADAPQCFLLTPKLLPGLPFSADVTVLQIFNGAHIADVAAGFRQDRLFGAARAPRAVAAA